jgi:DNA-directed RNA polymerase alpha subunit
MPTHRIFAWDVNEMTRMLDALHSEYQSRAYWVENDVSVVLDDIPFSQRILNAFKLDNIKCIKDLLYKTESELLRIPNLGRVSLEEIKTTLKDLELELWPSEDEMERNMRIVMKIPQTNLIVVNPVQRSDEHGEVS